MKKWFAAALLVLSIGYTAYGLSTLTLFTASGRPAAGFFPLFIGLLLVITCAVNLLGDIRQWAAEKATGARHAHRPEPAAEKSAEALGIETAALDGGAEHGRDVLIVFGYVCAFVAALKVLGALLSMIAFMLVFLFTFNRGHTVTNIVYSLALPGFLFWLFKILLNASLPVGPLGV
ncbi:MAG: tripartite tricarboxylate transporter TctB family protein [Phyllobacteriaceae bacterium]|nr:tripartite tricarboxylate transporter TctB family protein [Phyllobacteriaceae bacterium]